jgi:hypothetical protein
LSSHHLGIETGRHARAIIPADQRYCNLCPSKIDDEIHFITNCCKFQTLRNQMFTLASERIPIFDQLNNREKFLEVMTTEDMDLLVAVGKYAHNAWKI